MHSSLSTALALIRRLEGGYVADPRDPGGCTNMGITLATYRAHSNRAATCRDLKRMGPEVAERIYRAGYWDAIAADLLPVGVDLMLFDIAIHSGPGRVVPLLQEALAALRLDRPSLPSAALREHLAVLRSVAPEALVRELVVARLAWLRGLKTWPRFGKGWTNRVIAVRDAALGLIEKKDLETKR